MAGDGTNADLIAHLTSLGLTPEHLTRREASRLFDAWCEAFMQPAKLRTGKWRHRGFHWHAFSSGMCPAESGRRAFELYRAEEACPLVVIPESWGEAACVKAFGRTPDLTPTGLDLYLFPESLDWTMAFTHEQPWLGSYFTRREWYRAAG